MSSPDKSFLDFYDACQRQEVKLDDEIAQAGFFYANDGYRSNYAPNGVLAAVREAGNLLSDGPQKLANDLIVPTDDFNTDLPTQTLMEIINASILRSRPERGRLSFRSGYIPEVDNCGDAEIGFMRTAEALTKIKNDSSVISGAQLFLHKDQPALIRKSAGGFESAIGLVPLAINGIPYPAGSLYSLDFAFNGRGGDEQTPPVPEDRVEVYDARKIERLRFLRLSAFALNKTQRKAAGFQVPRIAEIEEPDLYMQLEVEDFIDAARQALARLDQIFGGVGRSALELAEV